MLRCFACLRCQCIRPATECRTLAACAPQREMPPSKRKTETEVKRAEIFELMRVRIYTVIEANRADRQFVTQASTNRIAHVIQPDILRRRQQISSVSEHGALQFAENRECVFNVEDGKKFSADRMTVII